MSSQVSSSVGNTRGRIGHITLSWRATRGSKTEYAAESAEGLGIVDFLIIDKSRRASMTNRCIEDACRGIPNSSKRRRIYANVNMFSDEEAMDSPFGVVFGIRARLYSRHLLL